MMMMAMEMMIGGREDWEHTGVKTRWWWWWWWWRWWLHYMERNIFFSYDLFIPETSVFCKHRSRPVSIHYVWKRSVQQQDKINSCPKVQFWAVPWLIRLVAVFSLWKWHWGRLFTEYVCCPLSVIPSVLYIFIPVIRQRINGLITGRRCTKLGGINPLKE